MKIAWFSPIPPESTEIANYTNRLLPRLNERFDVEVFYDQGSRLKLSKDINKFKPFMSGREHWRDLNKINYLIYHIGNNPQFHKGIWEMSMRKPGIVVLHDEILQHFFIGIYRDLLKNKDHYLRHMKEFYGEDGYCFAEMFFEGKKTIEELSQKYPLTQLAYKNAMGVVVHTNALYEKIVNEGEYPVLKLNLPHDPSGLKRIKEVGLKKPYSLVVFGYIGPNRRLEAILKAFAECSNRDDFRFTIMGNLVDKERYISLIKELGIEEIVEIAGFVTDKELDHRLAQADLAFNLRYPTMGEASASQLRIWDHALPSLVTNTGWYAELPDNTVYKVSVTNEKEDIHKYLQMFVDRPEEFNKVGKNGRAFLIENHSSQQYVEKLKAFLVACDSYKDKQVLTRYLTCRSVELTECYTINNKSFLLDDIARKISSFIK